MNFRLIRRPSKKSTGQSQRSLLRQSVGPRAPPRPSMCRPGQPETRMKQPAILRKLVIFGVPLVLGLIETAHPALWPNDPIFPVVHAIATWWTVLHVLQVPLFALLGLAVLFLIEELKTPFATISRYSIILFIVVYPAFDAAVGISSGLICRKWSAADGPLIEGALQDI